MSFVGKYKANIQIGYDSLKNAASPHFPILMADSSVGLNQIIAVIGASLIGVFGFVLVLIFGAQVGGNAGLYGSLSASNVTKITTNIGNGVVAGSGFVVLIFLGAAGAVTLGIFLLVFSTIQHFRGSGK
jgi:hypothetical protein